MTGVKHLIQCHCILPQYRKRKVPVFHKFIVFSVIDDNDQVIPKIVECNSCAAVHKITEIGKSEIAIGKDDLKSITTKDDIKLSLPESIVRILTSYNSELSTWEETQFVFENSLWGSEIILTKDEISGTVQGKLLRVINPMSVKIETFTRDESAI